MKTTKKFIYAGLPVLGVLFYMAYLYRASIDMVYSDYIRLINSYLPDVWNPEKFFVADLLTRIPVNFLERGINVQFFGYSVMFDRLMSVLSCGAAALLIGKYCEEKRAGAWWYLVLMAVMFSLNKWEMLYNGTGWAHFLAFVFFYYTYLVLDRVYSKNEKRGDRLRLLILPAVTTIGLAGPYCAIYTMTLLLSYLFIFVRNRVILSMDRRQLNIKKEEPSAIYGSRLCRLSGKQILFTAVAAVWPFAVYLWSNSQAVYEYSGAVSTPLLTAFFQEPKFFLKFFLKSFASMIFGVELIDRRFGAVPGKVWCILGLFVLACYFLALWLNFYCRLVEKTIFPLMLLAGGGMNHLMVLVSRYIFMPNDDYGMSSRYALQYQVGILGILLTFALAAKQGYRREGHDSGEYVENAKPSGASRWIRFLAVAAAAVFLVGNIMTTAEEFSFGKYRKEHNLEVREIVLNFENETDEALMNALEYRKPGVREALTILKENQWNVFAAGQNGENAAAAAQ